jgi:hypothetical protein
VQRLEIKTIELELGTSTYKHHRQCGDNYELVRDRHPLKQLNQRTELVTVSTKAAVQEGTGDKLELKG